MRFRAAGILATLLLTSCAAPSLRSGAEPAAESREVGSWRAIADGPLSPRTGAFAVWTGSEMILWGGSGPTAEHPREGRAYDMLLDGAAYDPQTDTWRTIADSPLPVGWYSAVWTGSEMILWGAARDRGGRAAAAYDPETDRWRTLADPPLPARTGAFVVWTGSEMIVWGGSLRDDDTYDGRGAAYDPARDSWRTIARGPLPAGYDAMGAWTGDEVVMIATPLDEPPPGRPKRMMMAAYDPAADAWRRLATPTMAPWMGPPVVLVGRDLFVLSTYGPVDGGEVNPFDRPYETGGIYDVDADRWRDHRTPTIRGRFGLTQIAIGDQVALEGLLYAPADDRWSRLPDPPLEPRSGPSAVWTGEELIIWGGEAHAGGLVVDPPRLVDDGAAYRPA